MARRTPSQLNMLLAVDKPVGCTSHDVVSQCRRALHERRVGPHAGDHAAVLLEEILNSLIAKMSL